MLTGVTGSALCIELHALASLPADVYDGWERLTRQAAVPPIAEPAFLRSWATHRLHRDEQAIALCARSDGELYGLLPLLRGELRVGHVAARGVSFVGRNAYVPGVSGSLVTGPVGDAVAQRLAAAALDLPGWDLTQLNSLLPGGAWDRAFLAAAEERGLYHSTQELETCVRIELEGGFDALLQRISKRRGRQLRKLDERLAMGGWTEQEVAAGPGLDRALDEMFELAASSWQGEEGTSIANDPAARTFYREVCLAASRRGALSLWLLHREARPAAFLLCLLGNERAYALKTGFDPAQSELGPGVVIHGCALRAFAARGVRSLELFHPASEDKRRWNPCTDRFTSLRVFGSGLRGRMLATAERLRRLVG